jgi:hypothetical protein
MRVVSNAIPVIAGDLNKLSELIFKEGIVYYNHQNYTPFYNYKGFIMEFDKEPSKFSLKGPIYHEEVVMVIKYKSRLLGKVKIYR